MEATIFDGSTLKPCTVADAKAAANQPGISWIDIRMKGGDESDATAMLQAVGIESSAAHDLLTEGLSTEFTLTPTDVHGVCWIDDEDGTPAEQVYFAWNQLRMVTLRKGGDKAISNVRNRVTERAYVLRKDPSTLLGVVLQLMLSTLQHGLTGTMIGVGSLDMEIIATATPKPEQTERLIAYRTAVAPLALRFPMYLINVQSALIDPAEVAGLGQGGMAQMQQFLASAQSTNGLIDTLADGIRNAAQDIQGQVSTWQGNRINVLTIVTMVFLPISFLTGYFGMNFNWLDDQLNSFWSWFLLGVALPIVLVVVSVTLLASSGYTLPRMLRRRHRHASAAGAAAAVPSPPPSRP